MLCLCSSHWGRCCFSLLLHWLRFTRQAAPSTALAVLQISSRRTLRSRSPLSACSVFGSSPNHTLKFVILKSSAPSGRRFLRWTLSYYFGSSCFLGSLDFKMSSTANERCPRSRILIAPTTSALLLCPHWTHSNFARVLRFFLALHDHSEGKYGWCSGQQPPTGHHPSRVSCTPVDGGTSVLSLNVATASRRHWLLDHSLGLDRDQPFAVALADGDILHPADG